MAYWDQYQPVAQFPEGANPRYVPMSNPGTSTGSTVTAAPPQPANPTQQPQTTGTPAPTGATGGSDPQSTFMRIMQGLPATPANLAAKESELAAAGIYVHRNAEGVAGKVQIGQNGPIIDVVPNAGLGGGGNWQWLGPGDGAGGAGGGMGGFQVGSFTGGGQYPLSSVMGTGLAAPWVTPFKAPTDVTEQNDPGFQFRLKEGQNALERSAASKGTLLTGGLLKGLNRYAQDYASGEYGNVYNRALGEYMMAHNIFEENQGNLFNRLGFMSGIGENAAAGVGNAQIGMGNAAGQGSIAQGNIWGNAVGNAGSLAGGVFGALNRPPASAASNTGTSYVPGQYYPAGSFTP